MKTIKKLTILFLFVSIVFACSNEDEDDASGCDSCTYSVASGETVATVPNEIIGEFDLVLTFSQGGYAFADGTKGKFTISEKEMKIEIEGQECITLKNPTASANQLEFTFRDTCRDNLKYSASISSNGGLNEVNVFTLSGTFYGQFK